MPAFPSARNMHDAKGQLYKEFIYGYFNVFVWKRRALSISYSSIPIVVITHSRPVVELVDVLNPDVPVYNAHVHDTPALLAKVQIEKFCPRIFGILAELCTD